jgi:uncharacterized protein YqeY
MSENDLKTRIAEAMKDAMRARDKARLGTIRLMMADIKRVEVDERIELDDQRVLVILDRMCKQRRDAAEQFRAGQRDDLAINEEQELAVIQEFLPSQLDEAELQSLVDAAIASTSASSMKDMGAVMGILKPQAQGRADMGALSKLVRSKLS